MSDDHCNRAFSGAFFFFFQAEDGIRDVAVTGVQTCALPILALAVLGGSRPKGRTSQECHGRTEKRSAVCAHESLSVRVSRRVKGVFIEEGLQVWTGRGGGQKVFPPGVSGRGGVFVLDAGRGP